MLFPPRIIIAFALVMTSSATELCAQWKLHVIDNSSQGADGVRIGDINNDGLPDFVTGWEEGGKIRICINPGFKRAKIPWPSVTIGEVRAPEDAFWADINQDGVLEVISCCEGKNKTSYIHHLVPPKAQGALEESSWRTEIIGPTRKKELWMFGDSADLDNDGKTDLVLSSKGNNASISLLQQIKKNDDNPKSGENWRLTRISDAGWIMSLRLVDIDHDNDLDVLVSDRMGPLRGVRWLENPLIGKNKTWENHFVGGQEKEVMFLDLGDIDSDGKVDIVCATRNGHLVLFAGLGDGNFDSRHELFQNNPENIPHGKAVKIGDLDGDGDLDIAHTTNTGSVSQANGRSGVHWLENPGKIGDGWKGHRISDIRGRKFDRIELIDLDGDNDLDLITCEERDNLGLVWYENPVNQ